MKKILLSILFILIFTTSSFAVDYTISTNARQEQILTWIVNRHNQTNKTNLTNQQYLVFILSSVFQDYVRQYWQDEANKVKSAIDLKWDNLTQIQRNQIKQLFGID